jgi:hypothetical protein
MATPRLLHPRSRPQDACYGALADRGYGNLRKSPCKIAVLKLHRYARRFAVEAVPDQFGECGDRLRAGLPREKIILNRDRYMFDFTQIVPPQCPPDRAAPIICPTNVAGLMPRG